MLEDSNIMRKTCGDMRILTITIGPITLVNVTQYQFPFPNLFILVYLITLRFISKHQGFSRNQLHRLYSYLYITIAWHLSYQPRLANSNRKWLCHIAIIWHLSCQLILANANWKWICRIAIIWHLSCQSRLAIFILSFVNYILVLFSF